MLLRAVALKLVYELFKTGCANTCRACQSFSPRLGFPFPESPSRQCFPASLSDCSKIATTQIVNEAELFLRQNLAAWKVLPADQKTPASMFSKKRVLFFLTSSRTKKCHKGRRFSQQGGQHGC